MSTVNQALPTLRLSLPGNCGSLAGISTSSCAVCAVAKGHHASTGSKDAVKTASYGTTIASPLVEPPEAGPLEVARQDGGRA